MQGIGCTDARYVWYVHTGAMVNHASYVYMGGMLNHARYRYNIAAMNE